MKEAKALNDKAKELMTTDAQQGILCYLQALEQAEVENDLLLQQDINLKLCYIHRNLSNMKEGFYAGIRAANLSQALLDVENTVRAYNFMGIFCFYVGLYKRAMHYFYYGLDNRSSVKNMSLLASIYTNLGETYLAVGNFEQALESLETASVLVREHDVTGYFTPILCNIGNVYLKQNVTELAEIYLKEASAYQHLSNDELHVADLDYKMGLLWLLKADYEKAYECFTTAEQKYRKVNHRYYLIDVLIKKAETMTHVSVDERITLLNEAKQLSLESETQGKLAMIEFMLHAYAVEKEDYKTALTHYQAFHEYTSKTDAKNLLAKLEIMSIEQDFRSEIRGEIDLQDFANMEIFGEYNIDDTIENLKQDLHYKALTDALTGLPNRRKINERLSCLASNEYGCCHGFLLIDIDHFKLVNDSAGHLFGDRCLNKVATVLKRWQKERNCFVGRYGGEEFLCIVENLVPEMLIAYAEELRVAIEAESISYEQEGVLKQLTVSIGCSVLNDKNKHDVFKTLEQADRSLYMAKMNGRNRVVLHHETEC